MSKPYQVLRIARWALLVLAYLSGGLSLMFAGFWPLIEGGEPVALLEGGPLIPARVLGLWNIVFSAPLTFLFFYVPSGAIALLLDVREKLSMRSGSA